VSEAVGAFLGCEGIEQLSNSVPEGIPGSLCGLAQESLELGEDHLDGIEIRRIGRQVDELGAPRLDGLANAFDFVGWQVVDHDHVAFGQAWGQHLLDISEEGLPIHWSIENQGRDKAIKAQSGSEGGSLPMAEGRLADQSLSLTASTTDADHLGRGPGLVDEDQLAGIKPCLAGFEALPGLGDVGPILLGRVQRFF
jgi:hypothetical protein